MRTATSPPGNREAGYTLIELLVVLAIIAGLTALAVPIVGRGMAGIGIERAARVLASDLRYLQQLAIREQREFRLQVIPAEQRYRLEPLGVMRQLPADVGIDAGARPRERPVDLRFYPDGSSTGGVVTLARGEQRIAVRVHWLSGRVSGA